MKEGNGKAIAAEVVRLLEESRSELEKYRHTLVNDQRQLTEHLENLRKELIESLEEMRKAFSDTRSLTAETSARLLENVHDLQDLLKQLPGTEPAILKNWLNEIRKNLSLMIRNLGGASIFSERILRLLDKAHRMKIKLDIIRLKLKLGAMEIREAVADTRKSFRDRIARIRTYASQKEKMIGSSLNHFRKEVTEAYDHLNKALASK